MTFTEMDAYDAIADPIRRGIVDLVALRSLPAGRIAESFGDISRPAVSRHLRVLREAGLVRVEPSGRERIYRANLGALDEITSWIGSLQPDISGRIDAMETEVYRTRRERRDERDDTAGRPDTSRHRTGRRDSGRDDPSHDRQERTA